MRAGFYIFLVFYFSACKNSNAHDEEIVALSQAINSNLEITEVQIEKLIPQNFTKKILSRGKIRAKNTLVVQSPRQGNVIQINLEIGERVKKGQILMKIDDFELKNELKRLKLELEKAQLKYNTTLIALGYNPNETIKIPKAIHDNAKLEANIASIENQIELLNYNIEKSIIKSPISGIISEINISNYNYVSHLNPICTIIDDTKFEISFLVLESELEKIKIHQEVNIFSTHNNMEIASAKIKSITPQITNEGMVVIIAEVISKKNKLINGQYANVEINYSSSKELVVPKSAVVDRQGKLVVFTYVDGKSIWNYVEIGFENQYNYSIRSGLNEGDTIIISNNFNLSHLANVKIQEIKTN